MKSFSLLISLLWLSVANAFLPSAFRLDYSQEEKSLATGRIKKSEGRIEYRAPGRIRFEIKKPHQLVFVANPKRSWYYTAPAAAGEPGEVTISSGSSHPILKFFDILSSGFDKNNFYEVSKKDGVATLNFSKQAQEEFSLKSAILTMGSDYTFPTLTKIAVTLTDGKTISMKVFNLVPNVAMSDSYFNFEIPANTRQHRQ